MSTQIYIALSNKLFRIAGREGNKEAMKNRAIFIKNQHVKFPPGEYCLNMIVRSDSDATGPEKDRPDVIIELD